MGPELLHTRARWRVIAPLSPDTLFELFVSETPRHYDYMRESVFPHAYICNAREAPPRLRP
jgi:hypothetical protein